MLGDIGNYRQILIGGILIWVALGMLGVEKCSMSGSLLYRLNLKGILLGRFAPGAATFLDGLAIYVGESPVVSIPIAIRLFFMMYSIMVKIDFADYKTSRSSAYQHEENSMPDTSYSVASGKSCYTTSYGRAVLPLFFYTALL